MRSWTGLRSTQAVLLTLRDEEIPQRIGFVSDRVYEPSVLLRWWRAFGHRRRDWDLPRRRCFRWRSLSPPCRVLLRLRLPQRKRRTLRNWYRAFQAEFSRQIDVAVQKAVAETDARNEQPDLGTAGGRGKALRPAAKRRQADGIARLGPFGKVRQARLPRGQFRRRAMKLKAILAGCAAVALGAVIVGRLHWNSPFQARGADCGRKKLRSAITTLADDPYLLIGDTRGVYLEGYGAVFTTEVNLANGPSLSPFRPSITKDDIARIRAKKLERFPILRPADA